MRGSEHTQRSNYSGPELVCGYNYRPEVFFLLSDIYSNSVPNGYSIMCESVYGSLVPQHTQTERLPVRNLSGVGTWSPIGGKKNSPERHRDNGRCVHSALTSHTLRALQPQKSRGRSGRPGPFALGAGLCDAVHASCRCQRGLSTPLFYCRRPLSCSCALSLSLNLPSRVTLSRITQHREKKRKEKKL